ncbi:MAG: alpha/beta hydrolase [Chitinophagaceae bacterium]|nr:alpha/beta hydrolase [Chitinophagaceae bacterium]
MKQSLSILFAIVFWNAASAQSKIGITNIPDSSYNVQNEYKKVKKEFPAVSIVQEFQSSAFTEKRNISYCKTGERSLLLDVFSPTKKSKTKKTAIIIIHGGGWRSGHRSLHYPMAQRLAQMGYVCFTPEYRLSTEALYPAAIYDLKAAVRWIKKNATVYGIDTTKVVALGHSAGGELAAFLGATNQHTLFEGTDCNLNSSSAINAVIDIDGTLAFIHPESGEGDDSKRTSAATYWFGYTKTENPELWKQAAPLTHAGKQTPPTLFLNSAVARMHAGREDYLQKLNQYNIYTEVHDFDGAPHSFCLFEPWFTPMINYVDHFLKKVFPK